MNQPVPSRRRDWSRVEVEAVVADYFDMLGKERRGEPFSKTEHRRRLMRALDGRSEGSIEYKHQNISAALNELGFPGIEGYQPAIHYQDLLLDVVGERLDGAKELVSAVAEEVERPAEVPSVDDMLSRLVQSPVRSKAKGYRRVRERPIQRSLRVDYLLKEARNASLGVAGEEFVLNFERARLLAGDREGLAVKIEHVSKTRGDHEGFDVLSFELDGRERLIEVKTTAFGSLTPFFTSANQVARSQRCQEQYHVYRLFRFRRDPHLFSLMGSIPQNCELEVKEYVARVR